MGGIRTSIIPAAMVPMAAPPAGRPCDAARRVREAGEHRGRGGVGGRDRDRRERKRASQRRGGGWASQSAGQADPERKRKKR
eukprot:364630-Chlamydomonas_euryale.AAC.26